MSIEFLSIFSPPILSLPLFISLLTFLTIITILFHPGGLAWAYSNHLFHSQPLGSTSIPGPVGAPILGLVRAFSSPTPHRVLAKLAQASNTLGLMAFSIGSTRFIITSKPEPAKQILNSSAFADRPVKESAYKLLFSRAMGFAPFGEYWRNLRRISSVHLFSPRRIAWYGSFREDIGGKMVKKVRNISIENGVVRVREVLYFGSLNNIMMSVFGKMYDDFNGGENGGDGVVLEELVKEGYELLGVFNWNDHFAPLGWLDLQGVRRRCRALVEKVNVFVGKIIEEHRVKKENNGGNFVYDDGSNDFVDVLLDLDGENKLSHSDIVAVLWEMIFRGTDIVAILLEWILARMVLHPDIQAKAQAEIDLVTGTTRPVSDSDLPNLPYLQAIVKETLRVHPPGPLLSWARLAVHDTQIGPHFIPAGTTAMVNMWAIAHDESIWASPHGFEPERFIAEDVPIMGSDLRLAPFGAGRRVCPGKAMGLATVHLWLAQMLQSFKWVDSDEHGVDLTENLRLTMEMKTSLVCKAIPRNVLGV